MFGSLRKLISAKFESPRVNSVKHDDFANNPNFVTNPGKIIKLLRQVMAAIPLSSVNLNNSSETFYSSILDIQPENDRLIIDKISPAYGNSALLASREFKMTAIVNGVQVSFITYLIDTQFSEKLDYYQAYLPTEIFHPQLRESPRIAIKSTNISFQGTVKTSGHLVKGYITDFSRGGVSISCTSLNDSLNRGDTLIECQINLSNNQILSFDLSVRTLKKTTYLGQQRQIGGYFHNLSAHDQKILDRYVSALEREQIRKLRKD